MTPEELLEDAESIGGLEPDGEPEPVTSSRRRTRSRSRRRSTSSAGDDVLRPGDGQAGRAIDCARPRAAARSC